MIRHSPLNVKSFKGFFAYIQRFGGISVKSSSGSMVRYCNTTVSFRREDCL